MTDNYELCIVIPVYNEEKNITALIEDWEAVFNFNNISHRYIIINDGSTDNSLELLNIISNKIPNITIHTFINQGHGPSILKAYTLSLNSTWVFQIDSDHQLDTSTFNILWKHREDYDILIGRRKHKNATLIRNFVSFLSRMIVTIFYGNKIDDVNSPYRLMRTEKLKEALPLIAEKTFAPNVLVTAYFTLRRSRIFTTDVQVRKDAISRKSKMNMYFLKGCLQSIYQAIFFRFKL